MMDECPTELNACTHANYIVMKCHLESITQQFEDMFRKQQHGDDEKTQLVEELRRLTEELLHAKQTIHAAKEENARNHSMLQANDEDRKQLRKSLQEKENEITALRGRLGIQNRDFSKRSMKGK